MRCAMSIDATHHGSSAQLAVRVLKKRAGGPKDVSSTAGQERLVWQRMATREAQTRELSLTIQVDDTAETIGLALIMTGDGRARLGPITIAAFAL